MCAWLSQNCMTSQTRKRRKHALTFLVFPSVKFCQSLYASWYRCLLHNIIFCQNFIQGFLFFNQKYKIARFLRIRWINFSFFQIIVRNRWHKTAEFQDILPRLKEAKRWKIAKNGYLYDCLLPWQQSAIYSYERKWNPRCECQELKPKVETNTPFLVHYPSSGVDTVKTVRSYPSSIGDTLRVVYLWRLSWTYYRTFQGFM